jgi:multiple sugar transport system permease protein
VPGLAGPFGLYLMRVHAQDAVPDSILEAARIDGAVEVRIFFQVALRSLARPLPDHRRPGHLVVAGRRRQRLQRRAPRRRHHQLITIVPLVAAFLMLQRYWQSGLIAGGVKE